MLGSPLRDGGRAAVAAATAVALLLLGGLWQPAAPASAAVAARTGSKPQASPAIRPFGARPEGRAGVNEYWDTGSCPSFLPSDTGPVAPPGDVQDLWAPLQSEAIGQTEELYGQTGSSDPSSLYANDYARGLTRAFMFADLVKAIDDVAAGKGTATEISEVNALAQVVQYGREWVALDANNLFSAYSSAGAIQSSVTNDIFSVIFGYLGLPWQNQSVVPSVTQLMDQAQGDLWGPSGATTDSAGDTVPNYPLGGAESQQAVQQTLEALTFLNAIGQTQLATGGTGSNPGLDAAMASIENAMGQAGEAGSLAESVVKVTDIASLLGTGEGASQHAGLIESLVNIVWQGADTAATGVQLNDNLTASQKLPSAADLQGYLGSAPTFDELFSDFVALTLHTRQNAGATGNDPDCRQTDKVRDGATPLGPTASDPPVEVVHYLTSAPGTGDCSFSTQTIGGPQGANNCGAAGEIADPAVVDWSLSRDTGPGAPRVGANWPISEISYGIPGPPGSGYLLNSPSPYYPASGSWYVTFNGADGQQHQTAPLKIYVDSNGTVHPTDSEVEQAILNADPSDFAQQPCSGAYASDLDPAVPANDQGQGPCTDWNFSTHYGTDLLVSGDQTDNNKQSPPEYQVIFDIMVKGDLGGWDPVFTGHTDTCGNGGICVYTLLGAPLVGDNITSQVIWPMQQNDVCPNDPMTCDGNATFGWGDQYIAQFKPNQPQPYPVAPECQAVSPVAGMFQITYVGMQGGNPNCDATPDAASWVMTPSVRYQDYYGNLWTAWRVPSSVGTYSMLNIETAKFSSGMAGIDPNCGPQAAGSANATCLVGKGTHWQSEFSPGDQILLEAPNNASGNGTGGLQGFVRTVGTVIDDTHMLLTSSAECQSGSDGNDCSFFNTSAYTSFMNPANGSQGDQSGMITLPCGSDCVITPANIEFDIWKLTGLNAGTNCSTWNGPTSTPHPPTTGCYYSDYLQFRAQDGTSNGWWDAGLPPAASRHAARPRSAAIEAWLNAPIITRSPQDALVGAGATAAFTAAATGNPAPTVQWQVSTDHAATWSDVAGATATTYRVPVTTAENGYDYRAVFTNSHGMRTTAWGTLNVIAAPRITKNPASVTLSRGQTATLHSAGTGDPAAAPTWQISRDGGATWQVLATGRPSVSISFPTTLPSGIAAAFAGRGARFPATAPQYLVRAVYRNAYGSATSQTAVITFNDTYPDVGVAAAVSPSPAAAGFPASALVTVGDYSAVSATSVKAVTTFSSSLDLQSFKQISGPTATCAKKAVTGGTSETCTWATLPGGGEAKFRAALLPVKGTSTGTVAMNATLAEKNGALGTATVTVPISGPWADLGLSGSAKKKADRLAQFADVLSVRNGGPAASNKAKLTIWLPATVKLVSVSAPGALCGTHNGVITCTIAKLLAGKAVTVTLHLKGTKAGASTLVANAGAATRDYNLANNGLSLSTVITP